MTFAPARPSMAMLGVDGHRSDMISFFGGSMPFWNGTSETNASWPTNNLSLAIPFQVLVPVTVTRLYWINGSAPASSADCGIYDSGNSLLVSTGAQAAAGTLQITDVTDTALTPGLYSLALAAPLTTFLGTRSSVTTSTFLNTMGAKQMATNYVLGATFVPATYAQNFVPNMGLVCYQAVPS